MVVRLRGKIYHYDFMFEGVPRRGTTKCTDRKEAEKFEAAVKRGLEQAVFPDLRADPTFAEVARDYMAANHLVSEDRKDRVNYLIGLIGPERKMGTVDDVMIHSLVEGEHIKQIVGHRHIKTPFTVEDFLRAIGDERFPVGKGQVLDLQQLTEFRRIAQADSGDVPSYINYDGRGWRQVDDVEDPREALNGNTLRQSIVDPIFAIIRHSRESNFDVRYLRPPKRDRHRYAKTWRFRTLSFEEEMRLFDVMDDDLSDMVEFALVSMMRSSNITSLTWSEVKLREGRIEVIQKGARPFVRPINEDMHRVLLRREAYGTSTVFSRLSGHNDGRFAWTNSTKQRAFVSAVMDAGIEDFRFHDLRRTGASRLYDTCHDIESVRAALGHTEAKTTWQYIHRDPVVVARSESLRSVRDALLRAAVGSDRAAPSLPSAQGIDLEAHVISQREADVEKVMLSLPSPPLGPRRAIAPAAGPKVSTSTAESTPWHTTVGSMNDGRAIVLPKPIASEPRVEEECQSFEPTDLGVMPVYGIRRTRLYAPLRTATLSKCYSVGPDDDEIRIELAGMGSGTTMAATMLDLDRCGDLRPMVAAGPVCVRIDDEAIFLRDIDDYRGYLDMFLMFDHPFRNLAVALVAHEKRIDQDA